MLFSASFVFFKSGRKLLDEDSSMPSPSIALILDRRISGWCAIVQTRGRSGDGWEGGMDMEESGDYLS